MAWKQVLAAAALLYPAVAHAQDMDQTPAGAAAQAASDALSASEQSMDGSLPNAGAATEVMTRSGSSHSESRSESSSFSLSVGSEDNRHDDGFGWGGGRREIPVSAIAGEWTLGETGGDSCRITLRTNSWFGGYGASTPAGCPKGIFSVGRWVMVGNELQLTETGGTLVARFRGGPTRWRGRRVADDAELYLNR